MASSMNTNSPTIKRILREAAELAQSPSPDFHAAPARDSDLFEWHFTLRGPPSSVFANGIYHGRIVLPPTYPLRPPSFRFLNASGRFEVNREICLSISGHHEETWMPAWGVRTALVALRSFMETDSRGQLGGMDCTATDRENYAKSSVRWMCSVCQKTNADILKECENVRKEMGSEDGVSTGSGQVPAELRIAFRDELETKALEDRKTTVTETERKAEESSCIQHLPLSAQHSHQISAPESRPYQALNDHLSSDTRQPQYRPQIIHTPEQNSPVWIDWIITVTAICLLLMVLKVLYRL